MSTVHPEKIIDGQAVGAAQIADPTAQRQPCDAGRRNRSRRRGHAEGVRSVIHVGAGATTLGPHGARCRVNPHAPHQRQVNDQATVTDPEAAPIVPAPASRCQHILLPGRAHGGHHIRHVHAAGDGSWPLVDHAVVDFPSHLVALIGGREDLAAELRLQLFDGFLQRHRSSVLVIG